ncbi:Hydrogenase transcriptional regulatory protein HupR1 [Candidatus Methylobacter favarea]|uniref:Hydrogenase transcriptional regulatory protein HupR1 n=1 Tax=Candidatus Methylobacter favarea TaxID=2707345 RepID=A0A8S0XJ05_9GAMM|nr:HD domain-containing phosphohydrolase [Candidatus Methylobacter favarea]CAA9892823.1 Hydrogenase transcriptional regulatory protein HupR1 [Candidatus Methylobacter favarea]
MTEAASLANDRPAKILFVDDEANVLKALCRLFHNEPYITYFAASGAEGLEVLRHNAVDLIISDMRMPEMNGAEFLAQIAKHWPETIRILLTGYADLQLTIDAVNKGHIYNYCNKPWNDEELKLLVRKTLEQKRLREERDRLSDLVHQQNKALKALNEHLEEKVEQRTEQLKKSMHHLDEANQSLKKQYIDSIRAFSRIIEMRPGIKSGHSKYIAENAQAVAKKMCMDDADSQQLLFAGLLLQLGKMTLPDEILTMSLYSMNREQSQRYLRHAQEAGALLKGLTQLNAAVTLIHYQYEHYDGSGGPEGLAGARIPLGSRILMVIRDYISYLEGSVTGQKMPVMEVRKHLLDYRDKHYDPNVVDAFLQHLGEGALPTNTRPVIEVSYTQLRVGMEIDTVSYDNKIYLRDCILTEQMINRIINLHKNRKNRKNRGIAPLIKVRIGADVITG